MKKLALLVLVGCAHVQTPIEELASDEVYVCRVSPGNKSELECMTLQQYIERVMAVEHGRRGPATEL